MPIQAKFRMVAKIAFPTFALLCASPSFASCPMPHDISKQEAQLLAEVQRADNIVEGQKIGQKLWKLWTKAPNQQAQELLERGMRARSSFDFLAANDAFNRLTEYCPDYAEGYNQRAFVSYLRQDYAGAIQDLDLALKHNPNHVGALSGKALSLMGAGRQDEAQKVLGHALSLNPWINERNLLLVPKGTDL